MPIADQFDAGTGADDGMAAGRLRHGHRKVVQPFHHHIIRSPARLGRVEATLDLLVALPGAVMNHRCDGDEQAPIGLARPGALEAIGKFFGNEPGGQSARDKSRVAQ